MKPIISKEEYAFYHKQGYLLIKNLYTKKTIATIRTIIEDGRSNGKWKESVYNNDNVTTHIYNLFPALIDLIFTKKFIQIIKELLGDESTLVLEPAIHRNRYGYWHKDSTFLDVQGETFHLNEDFCTAQTALYLQDNDATFGGGLTVIPKSQHLPDRFYKIDSMNKIDRAILKAQKMMKRSFYDKMEKNEELVNIETQQGDLVIFNYKIDHKGTPAKTKDIRADKYAIFTTFINKPKYTQPFIDGLRKMNTTYSKLYLSQNYPLSDQLNQKAKDLNIKMVL